MGRDNSPKIRRVAELRRKERRRSDYHRILIVTEGTKTEPNYFDEICREHRLNTANIAIEPSTLGTSPKQIVKYAKELFEKGNSHKKIKKRAFEQVYVVFDRDSHDGFFDALNIVRSLDGKLKNDNGQPIIFVAIVSIPCFELWLLLHFENIFHLIERADVLKKLLNHIPHYEKSIRGSFSSTMHNLEIAHERARSLCEKNPDIDDTQTYTNVWQLVKLLRELKK